MTHPYTNVNKTAKKINDYFENVSKWAHQWKISFNPDPTQMAKEVLFSRKKLKVVHSSPFQKHLVLDSKLNFKKK